MKLSQIIAYMDSKFPIEYACDWDQSNGLQVGEYKQDIKTILFALDPTIATVKCAVKKGADLIITHHPLFFNPLRRINLNQPTGKVLKMMIENNISMFSAHTNMDAAPDGINYHLALKEGLDIEKSQPLEITYEEKLFKYVVYVPLDQLDKIRGVIGDAGGGHIGNYSHCTFETVGKGHFKPLVGSNPHIGKRGVLEEVDEVKIETIVQESKLNIIVDQVKKAHPYEEVAYDLYQLEKHGMKYGIGLIGLRKKDKKRVAVSSGSGGSLVRKAKQMGAEEFITGEVGYHDQLLAEEIGLNLVIKGHYETEAFYMKILAKQIEHDLGVNVVTRNP